MTKDLSRRVFLRGLGGACVAAPFLSSLANRSVKAEPARAPQRLIVMFTHYGCITTRMFPKRSHGALSAEDLAPTTLKHLAPYFDKLLLPRGMRSMNEWTADMSRGQGNDPHLQGVGSYFTCQPLTPNSDNPFSFDQSTKFNAKPVGPSLDHVIAQQLSPDGIPLVMNIGGFSPSAQSAISYSAATTIFPGLRLPKDIFSKLTGLFTSGAPVSPDSYQAARGKSILDLVRDDLDTLQRYDMSQADRNKLEAWKELINRTGSVITRQQCDAGIAAKLGLTQDSVESFSTSGDPLCTKIAGTNFDGSDLYSQLAVLAAVCNANQVIVLKYPGNYVFKGLGMTMESASMANRLGNAGMNGPCVTDVIQMIATVDDYYARKFAHLAELLNSFDEGDQKLLDNTATVWFQEFSDGSAMNHNNLPIVQLGSAGGYFRTGWAVNVEDGSPNLTSGNSEGACMPGTTDMIDGVNQVTGTDAKYANAPINKYFCNLMNALGVKAGPDGFPQKGGVGEVTHYGMYDRTEDFVGGGTKPANISSPGEYTTLRAR